MTTLLLIRHAAFDGIGYVIRGRSPHVSLNDAGRTQAERLARRLAREEIDAIYASPLERAVETANAIAAATGHHVSTHAGLLELDWGEWTGKTLDDLRGDPEFSRFNRLRTLTRIPGGELMLEVQARALRALEDIRRLEAPDARVAVVSHADVIRAILCHCLGMPLDHLLRLTVDAASTSVIDLTAEHVAVRGINIGTDSHDTLR